MELTKKTLAYYLLIIFSVFIFDYSLNASDTDPSGFLPVKASISTRQAIQENLPADWPTNGLQIFPEAKRKPWLDAINSARTTIQMAAYKLSDPILVEAVIKAHKERNVLVKLLIQPEVHSHGQSLNVTSPVELLKKEGINVYTLSPRFNQAHYKMILIDGKWGMVSTGNLDEESFEGIKTTSPAPCRDFAITITNSDMLKELEAVFEADIADKRICPTHLQLVWGPDNQRSVFLKMINSARKSIRIYQQSIQDEGMAQALAGAARAGVKVELIMMPYPFDKKEDKNIPNQEIIRKAGGVVYLHNYHYIHAKLMIVDEKLMYVGSCNFYTPSLDQTRELGVLTADVEQIQKVNEVFDKDCLKIDTK